MKIGIVGFPWVGKSTLFSLMTGQPVESAGGRRDELRIGVAKVEDPRLDALWPLYPTSRKVQATIEYLDAAPMEKGEIARSPQLATLRNADAFLHVVRAFELEELPHSLGPIDPARDIETLDLEFAVADLELVEKRLDRLEKDVFKGIKKAESQAELTLLRDCAERLGRGEALRERQFSPEEDRLVRGYNLLTLKPKVDVLNIGEAELKAGADPLPRYKLERAPGRHNIRVYACARLELEFSQLDPESAAAFRAEYGDPPALAPEVVRACYEVANLISFFTVGDDEVRAWPIPRGTKAPEAAGAVHSDMEKGFIKAEVGRCEDLVEHKDFAHLRTHGKLRLEGRDYTVQDGDVIVFRFAR